MKNQLGQSKNAISHKKPWHFCLCRIVLEWFGWWQIDAPMFKSTAFKLKILLQLTIWQIYRVCCAETHCCHFDCQGPQCWTTNSVDPQTSRPSSSNYGIVCSTRRTTRPCEVSAVFWYIVKIMILILNWREFAHDVHPQHPSISNRNSARTIIPLDAILPVIGASLCELSMPPKSLD